MIVMGDTPTLGLLVGAPIGVLFVLGGVVWAAGSLKFAKHDSLPGIVCGIGAAVLAFGITSVAMWPWKYDYHYWVDKGGKVTSVDKRLVPAGDSGMQEKFVFDIGGESYGVTDTRAAQVRPGDTVDIACKKAYEWGSTDHGFDCRWNGSNE